jgi:predicted dehydrogenase
MENNSRDTINVAQLGVGYWGPNLLRNLISNPRFNVRAVVDLSEARRDFVKNIYPGIHVDSTPEAVFENPNIDAVVIATPVATHYDLGIRAVKSGKHVLVEKPMATRVEDVRNIGRVATEKHLTAMVGHTFLFNQAVRYVKGLIDGGELGDIRYIYSQRVNLGRIRNDVDALWNLAPHDVSIIQYWLGDPNPLSISTIGMDYVQKGINDVVFLNVSYPNKVMAHIHVSWLDPHKVRKMTVVGSKKMVVYDDLAENKIAVFDKGIDPLAVLGTSMDFDDPSILEFNHRSGDVIFPQVDWKEPVKVEIDHFADCVISGEKCITDAEHAVRVVDILSRA